MRRAIGIVALGLLMTLFCLVIGGLSCLEQPPVIEAPPGVVCKTVVGNSMTAVQVDFCRNYTTNECFYVNRNGGFLVTECWKHPFVEVEQ